MARNNVLERQLQGILKNVKKAAGSKECCVPCSPDCKTMKIHAVVKIVMGLLVLGFAAGVLNLNLAAWIIGLVLLVMGALKLKAKCI